MFKNFRPFVQTVCAIALGAMCGTGAMAQQNAINSSSKIACLQQALAKQPSNDLRLQVTLRAGGAINGLPVMLAPGATDTQARMEYLIAAAALETCAPFEHMPQGGVLQIVLSQSGQIQLDPPPATLPPLNLATPQPLPPLNGVTPQASLGPATAQTEQQLQLDKQGIRDVQARLQVSGHDPNGIDGALGRGTRGAIANWQNSQGLEITGYLNAGQLAQLKSQSQPALDTWLQDPANAALYVPPPPIAVGPGNMPGRWRLVVNCGRNSKAPGQRITGEMAIQHTGGAGYAGTIKTSQGLTGRVTATLNGRTVRSTTNYGLLLGKVSFRGRIDDQKLVVRGRDSQGCSVYAAKR